MPRIAIFQSRTGIDPVANSQALVEAIDEAAEGGAGMLFTPEMSGLLDRDAERARHSVRPAEEDQVLAACRESASRRGIWLHLGSLAVAADDRKFSNRAFVIDSAGDIRASYDKIHLFDVDLPTGESWRESAAYAGGERAAAAETPLGRLGLSICYDLRFPDLYRALSDAGATILSVPAAFTVPTGEAHWHLLLRARAVEAGVFVVAAAQTGHHQDGRDTYGHSLVVDPWGNVLLDMGQEVGVGFADIDPAQVDEVRSRLPAIHHRRPIPQVQVAQ